MREPKFKIGDKAIVVGNTNSHGFKIGEEIEIINTSSCDEFFISYVAKGKTEGFFVSESDITHLEPKEQVSNTDWKQKFEKWQNSILEEPEIQRFSIKKKEIEYLDKEVVQPLELQLREAKDKKERVADLYKANRQWHQKKLREAKQEIETEDINSKKERIKLKEKLLKTEKENQKLRNLLLEAEQNNKR